MTTNIAFENYERFAYCLRSIDLKEKANEILQQLHLILIPLYK